MKPPIVLLLTLASGLALACSSSPLSGSSEDAAGAAGKSEPGKGTGGAGALAPPTPSTWVAYPAGPYGTSRGATIANLAFSGWRHPDLAGYDPALFETVRLSDYYDPEGRGTVKLLAINASAVWCSVCRAEYQEMNRTHVYETLRGLGAEILGTLFEDNGYAPAQPQDLHNWGMVANHAVKFPLVLDPGFKMGAYFDSDATPLNLLIDVRTMTIVSIDMGYSSTYWSEVQAKLAKL
jgi:AhpC/TSA family protein